MIPLLCSSVLACPSRRTTSARRRVLAPQIQDGTGPSRYRPLAAPLQVVPTQTLAQLFSSLIGLLSLMSVFGRAKYLAVAAERRRTKLAARWPLASQLLPGTGAPSEAHPKPHLDAPRQLEWDASEADVRVVVDASPLPTGTPALPDPEAARPEGAGDSTAPSMGAVDTVLSAPDVDAAADIAGTPRIGTAGAGASGSRRDLVPGVPASHDPPEGPVSPRRLANTSSRSAISAWAAEAGQTQGPQLPGWAAPRPAGTAYSEA